MRPSEPMSKSLIAQARANVNALSTHARLTPLELAIKHSHVNVAEVIFTLGAQDLRNVNWTERVAVWKRLAVLQSNAGQPLGGLGQPLPARW